MSRPLRLQLENALYHVTSRGNEKATIFFDDQDRYVFLKKVSEVAERYRWTVYAYCLMGNHYHLLLRTEQANLSRGMRQLNGIYAQYFNRRHQRVGHVFQGRFKAILIKDEERLLTVARYVVLNPVRAGVVERPEDWKWSSYRATVGLDKPKKFLNPNHVLCLFSNRKDEATSLYVSFVQEGIEAPSPLADAHGGIILGEKEVAREVFEKVGQKIDLEIPKRERFAARPDLGEIFSMYDRKIGIYLAIYEHGYTLREVGVFLGMHYSAISRIANQVARTVS
ncbi:MAG: transposase [Actinobacteria bacterium]|nr:transposase [Actinomycetota bacterium]